ncbi:MULTISPECIES: hypothetical protein [Frankia]|uniref:Uncharacterized protein n=1 Tax=Frankia alni (strain DSM 45986 / CECT 9034 / ACN14a) TaxID=326424 RepID=Q0RIX8_FRAAA|nr:MULTISPECIES: hypothetical protein [Frankia]CAJ62537.1 hypothetical protein FRAAL3894 [Frankia alni ACN14a]
MRTRSDVDAALTRLRSGGAQLAAELLDLDALIDRHLGDPPRLRGRTAAIAADARRRLVGLWETHAALNDLLTAAAAERGEGPRLGARRTARLAALLDAEPDGDRPAGAAGAAEGHDAAARTPAHRRLEEALASVRALRAAADEIIAARAAHREALAPLGRHLAEAQATAQRLGLTPGGAGPRGAEADDGAVDDEVPALATARAALALAQAAVAADPLDVPAELLTAVGDALAPALDAVAALARAHDHLAADLAAADALLAQVVAAAQVGERRAREVVERISGHADGLLRLSDGWFDAPRRGLRPWLDRLSAAGEAGDWRLVAYGLPAWRRTAQATLATATTIAETNAAPVRRRDELRGLLRALRAKAGRTGLGESAALEASYAPALAALGSAPIDLDRAEKLVRAYADALLAAAPARYPARPEEHA